MKVKKDDLEYTQPLLTKHEPLLNLTGKSAEKIAFADKNPNEKDQEGKDPGEKYPLESGL
ncbi:MAG: hypothetical protein ACM3PP_02350 [Candidatus Saccharibacteria bacterium]